MKVRETIGTSVGTMVKMKVTTDGDQHQDEGECGYRSMGERRTTTTSERTRGYTQLGYDLRCNGPYPSMALWCLYSKVRTKREDERAKSSWFLCG